MKSGLLKHYKKWLKQKVLKEKKEIKDEIIGYVKDLKESWTTEHFYKDKKIKKGET